MKKKNTIIATAVALTLVGCGSSESTSGIDRGEGQYTNPTPTRTNSAPVRVTTSVMPHDLRLVYTLNAHVKSGRTVRWASRTVPINVDSPSIRRAASKWTGFNFQYADHGGIRLMGDSSSRPSCGWAQTRWRGNGTIAGCDIWINYALHSQNRCGKFEDTVSHEIGHCLGIQGHTNDGSLMDPTATGSPHVSPTTRHLLNVVYSVPPNTPVALGKAEVDLDPNAITVGRIYD